MQQRQGTIAHAVEAMKNGADDYLSKPFQRQNHFSGRKAENAHALKRRNKELTGKLSEQSRLANSAKHRVCRKCSTYRAGIQYQRDCGQGMASGTGKELAARALHSLSDRSAAAFIAVNCGAIPESLASRTFGAEKGAFTGANTTKIASLKPQMVARYFLMK